MEKICLTIVACLLSSHSYGQFKHFEKEVWYNGRVYMESGEVIEGLINYNFVVDLIRVDRGGSIRTYIPEHVNGFILRDSVGNFEQFITMPFDKENKGRKVPSFYQRIYHNTHYIVLSKYLLDYKYIPESTAFDRKGQVLTLPGENMITEDVSQVIFLADRSVNIQRCLEKEKAIGLLETERFKLSDKDAFRSFFGEHYHQFNEYVEGNGLNLSLIDDFIEAVDFRE